MRKRYLPIILLCLLAAPCRAEETPTAAATFAAGDMPVVEDVTIDYYDDQPDIVRDAQQRLAKLGFYVGSIDGKYGRYSEEAVRAFQRQFGLEETGHIDAQTLALATEYSEKNITKKTLQQRLIELGYLEGSADGKFGAQSVDALRRFQRLNGIEETGATDAETLDLLFSDRAIVLPAAVTSRSSQEAITALQSRLIRFGFMNEAATGKYGKITAQAVAELQQRLIDQGYPVEPTGTASPITLYYFCDDGYSSYLHDVSVGMSGDEVLRIERRLEQLGYMDMAADDAFDAYSREALRLFQQQSGLEADGVANRGTVDALFSEHPAALPAGLSADSEGEDVLRLQDALIRYGFMAEEADGAYGETTAAAVQLFQQRLIDQGYPVNATGAASPLTLYHLYRADYSSYLRDVSLGATDEEVRRIEGRLLALGYMDAAADDAFDAYAREALCLFQQQAGLEASGVADRGAIDALFAADAPMARRCAPHEISSGDSGLIVRDIENALLVAGYSIKLPDGQFDAAVEKGLQNAEAFLGEDDSATHLSRDTVAAFQDGLLSDYLSADTARIQRRLHTLYYLEKSGVDGVIGENTLAALHEFQETNGLPQTDGSDSKTLAALFSDEAVAKRFPYRVEVSLSRQVVDIWALNSQNEYRHVKSFTCSTGKNNTTPRGIFLRAFPANRWHYFKKFYCWAQYSFVIEGDILFHSVIFGSKNENSLHRSSVRALGNPASHGCVRLTVEDAKWLFEHCERGSLVVVIS